MTELPSAGAAVFQDAADREAAERARRAAAPLAAVVEAIGALEPDTRTALYTLLSSLADNKYVLGRRYAEWCTGAPMLESAVAAAAMAQDELGHARSFYPLLRGFPEATEADTREEAGWQNRPTSAMTCLAGRFEAWGDFIAANLLVDTALTILLEAAAGSPYEPLRQRARKIGQEELAHWVHAKGWVRKLGAQDSTRTALLASLAAMWDHAFTWYGLPDDPTLAPLTSAGILATGPGDLRERLHERLSTVLEVAGLAEELLGRKLPWDRWDPRARRLRPEAR
jgi:phenylacetate-CoA oxygenase PaaI subunit